MVTTKSSIARTDLFGISTHHTVAGVERDNRPNGIIKTIGSQLDGGRRPGLMGVLANINRPH